MLKSLVLVIFSVVLVASSTQRCRNCQVNEMTYNCNSDFITIYDVIVSFAVAIAMTYGIVLPKRLYAFANFR